MISLLGVLDLDEAVVSREGPGVGREGEGEGVSEGAGAGAGAGERAGFRLDRNCLFVLRIGAGSGAAERVDFG